VKVKDPCEIVDIANVEEGDAMALVPICRRHGEPPDRRSSGAKAAPLSTVARYARLALATVLLVVVLVGAGAAGGAPRSPAAARAATAAVETTASASPELIFKDPEFAFELRRTMSAVYAGEADVGECLATATRITDSDFESWYTEWNATAVHFEGVADQALARHHPVTARDAYYRAATYFRTAEFFLHGDPTDPRIIATWRESRDAFVTAAKHDTRVHFEAVWIPYDKTKVPGYFYAAKTGSTYRPEKRPLLIIQTGFDGCQEELHPYAVAAVERGYNVLTFEGPGQGQVIRVQGLPMRRDWEHVVRQIVDYAVARPDVDRKRIALWGISLGGYLAPRAAAFDHRIAAVVADAGIYDVGEILLGHLKEGQDVPPSMTETELHDWLLTDPSEFNDALAGAMKESTTTRWQNQQGMFVFKKSTPALMWADYMEFSLKGGLAQKVRCPTLVTWGETDSNDPDGVQANQLFENLTCKKWIMAFAAEYEAGYHCQLGDFALSWGQKFDWLDARMHP
jgi:pimeloyl-ACP methyl ester carboxylesterase